MEGKTMRLTINGDAREINDNLTLAAYLTCLNLRPQMVVVERNGEIVPRADYASTRLAENDTLELVQMMAGG